MAINSTNINIGKIYSYFICSQSIDQNIFPEVLRSAQCFFIFNVTLGLIIRYYCFSDWFNQVNIICDHVHIYCIIDARLQLAYETLQHITIGQRREEHVGKIYSYFICSQSIDQNIFPEVLRSAQCYIALYPAPGESLGFVAVTICLFFLIWWIIVWTTKQFAILGSVRRGECCPLCTLKASLVDVEKKIGISLLQQNQVTPQVQDTEQYNIELF
jgi:hypothetical protein